MLSLVTMAQCCYSWSFVIGIRMLSPSMQRYLFLQIKIEVLRRLFSLIALVSLFYFASTSVCCLIGFSFCYTYNFGCDGLLLLVSACFRSSSLVSGVERIVTRVQDMIPLSVIKGFLRRHFNHKALDFLISTGNVHTYLCYSLSQTCSLAALDFI
jgi:hypothetical protein